MCGICFVCSLVSKNHQHLDAQDERPHNCRQAAQVSQCVKLKDSLLQHRGPDASVCAEVLLPGNLNALMQGCVLHLRGDLTPQPITNSTGNALLWNGEIFGGIEVKDEENDTQVLFDLLDSCSSQESILQIFQKIDGPWAVIFWQAEAKTLWFGRDMFGRRSLLWHLPETSEDNFVLSSVALDEKVYKEIPSVGVFSMDFSQLKKQGDGMDSTIFTLPPIVLHPWLECRWPGTSLHVQRTLAEDLVESLYPDSQNHAASFLLSENGINRWIPTMYTRLLKRNVDQLKSCVSPSEESCTNTEQTHPHYSSSILKSGTLQANRHDLKESQAALEQDFEKVLEEIWEEKEDLHVLAKKCIETLQESVDTRVKKLEQEKSLPKALSANGPSLQSAARVAVLFSGGLDSTLLAALADRCLPDGEPIDLLNVAFEQTPPSVPQQRTAKQKKPRKHNRNNSHQVISGKEVHETDSKGDIHAEFHSVDTSSDISSAAATISDLQHVKKEVNTSVSSQSNVNVSSTGDSRLFDVLGSDIFCSPNPPVSQIEDTICGQKKNSKFSCSLDQEFSHSVSHSKSKHNLVFSAPTSAAENSSPLPGESSVSHKADAENQNPRSFHSYSKEASSEIELDSDCASPPTFDPFNVPDRQTGRIALSELNPRRQWNFVEINVTQAELQSVRQSHISRLIYPLRTVLDDSIGCAVWFAARGKGVVEAGTAGNEHQEKQVFLSRAQVLLCGMAADELFAGYSRHRVTFNKEGWSGLEKEIQEELWRISARNLGRDDRIIADHGKEARFPYLDEKFVQLVSEIPLQKRVDLGYPRGIGEKLLLRLCALNLGLVRTACQAKRAIQFGSKIAKLDNRKEKGTDVCDRLL